jgi:ribokinase
LRAGFFIFSIKKRVMMGGSMSSIAVAVALSEDKSLQEAIGIANAAGALCVTRPGAQQSMPWRKDLDTFLNTRCPKEQEIE